MVLFFLLLGNSCKGYEKGIEEIETPGPSVQGGKILYPNVDLYFGAFLSSFPLPGESKPEVVVPKKSYVM